MIIFLFGIGIISSQFYVFQSGTPQPAHYLILLSGLIFCVTCKKFSFFQNKSYSKYISIFVIYQFFINFIYFLSYQSIDFLVQSLYIFYGYFIFLLVLNAAVYIVNSNLKISIFAWYGLLILFFIALLGFGEYKFEARYNGYFNDPNQMALWVLCVTSIIMAVNKSKIYQISSFFIASILIIFTTSRSGLLGYSMLLLGFISIVFDKNFFKLNFKKFLLFIFIIYAILLLIYLNFSSEIAPISFFVNRVNEVDLIEQAGIRGYTRLFYFPQYLIFGAGHGLDYRFHSDNEIHSTLAALLFYYGLFGFLLFFIFCFLIFKNLSFSHRFFFLAPFLYSLSTFGMRTPIFWIFLGIFYVLSVNKTLVNIKH